MQLVTLGVIVAAGLAIFGVTQARAAQDVPTPPYTVEHAAAGFELRQYPELVVAQITKPGTRRRAVQSSFPPLARYIFARDRPGEKIAMTAPVMQEPAEAGWTVSFIMPTGLQLADLPAPAGDIALSVQPPRRMAVVRFSGRWTDQRFARETQRLQEWIAAQGLKAIGAPEYGYYNDPFTLPAFRRNEVLIEVAP